MTSDSRPRVPSGHSPSSDVTGHHLLTLWLRSASQPESILRFEKPPLNSGLLVVLLLCPCVTCHLHIRNVKGCDLVSILTSLKCGDLVISNQSLGREETRVLVQAMESRVEKVELGDVVRPRDEVTLDIEALTEYSGQGVCREVQLWYEQKLEC